MQNDLFENAFKFSPIGIALVSPEGKWLKVNNSLLKLLGYNEEEFLVLDFLQMTHPEDLKRDLDLVAELLAGSRESFQMEKRYFHKDGSIVYVLLSATLIRNEDGTPKFFIYQLQDISELKRAQEILENNSKMVAVGEMAAGIAHEINNPLTIISLHAKALDHLVQEKEVNREMVATFASKINQTVKRISLIVSSLRKFSSDNSKIERFENCKIASIVDDTVGLCLEKFKTSGVDLSLSISPDLELECNPLDISQVLMNLVNNAFYAVQNLDEKFISITAEQIDQTVILSVMDSGRSIPAEIRSKLLDPFFTTKPVGQGTGLGLSISRSIVKVHSGELYLDESSNRTNFVVKLPVKQIHSSMRSEASKTASRILPI